MSGARAWRGNLPFESLYTAGLAGQKFFAALKEKAEILGSRCGACAVTYVPARRYCERCMAELPEGVPVGNEGTVVSLTTVHVGLDGERLEKPVSAAAVRLDGATTVLIHRLLGPARIGDRVRVAFERRRKGSILDIQGFSPVTK